MPCPLPALSFSLFARPRDRQPRRITVYRSVLLAVTFFVGAASCIEPLSAQANNLPYGFVYTGGSSPSTAINEYSIDGTTGALAASGSSPFSAGGNVLDLAPHPSGNFLYALIAAASGNQIAVLSVDSQTGGLTPVPGSPYDAGPLSNEGGPAPPMLAVTPNGKFLYVGNHGNRQLHGLAVDSTTGALTPISQAPVVGDVLAMSPGGSYLYAYTNLGQTIVYSIDSTSGALTQVQSTANCLGPRPAIDPTGRFYYTGAAGIVACQIAPSTGMLSPVSESPFAANYGVGNLAIHPSAAFVYAVGEGYVGNVGTYYVHGYVVDASTGALTAMQQSPYAVVADYLEGIAAEPRGKYLYVTDANEGVIAYTTDSTTGEVSLVSNSATGPGAASIAVVEPGASSSPVPVSLSISPSSATIVTTTLGNQVQFTLLATFSDGSTGFLTDSASWSSSNPSIGTVAYGLVTAKAYGSILITASFGALSASAPVEIQSSALETISLSPSAFTSHAGTGVPFRATGTYQDGTTTDLTSLVSWQSSDPAVASIDKTGFALAATQGTTTITASSEGISGSANLNVVAAASPSGQFGHFVYSGGLGFGTWTGASKLINGYSISGGTGDLTPVALSPFAAGGSVEALAAHPSGNFLYATILGSGATSVAGFSVDAESGGLSPVPGLSQVGDGSILVVAPNGKFLYVGGSNGTIECLSINAATGALTPISQSSVRGSVFAINPAGTYLYGSDSDTFAYSIDPSTGALTQVQMVTGLVCSHIAIDSSGMNFYCLSQGIQAWQIDATSGKLTGVTGSPFASSKAFQGLAIDPSGSFLYSVVGETSSGRPIYGFAIDANTGALTAMQGSPFAIPTTPLTEYTYTYGVTVEQLGRYVYAVELNSGVASYAVNPTTGELTLVASSSSGPGAYNIASVGSSELWAPQLQWLTPQPITYGTQLSAGQLDATANVPGSFSYSPVAGTVLQAGTQTLSATFTPSDTTDYTTATASVTITVNPVSLVTLSPTSLAFGSATLGTASASQSVTLTNTGDAALSISGISVAGLDPSSFVFTNNCGTSLAAGASCSIQGHFAPVAGGALTAAVTITDNAGNSPQKIGLSGTGLAPEVLLTPSTLPSFGPTIVGQTSGSGLMTLMNTGAGTLNFSSVAITGVNANQFKLSNSCGTSVPSEASCTFTVTFAPTVGGSAIAELTFADNAIGSPQQIVLSGTGVAPVLAALTSPAPGSTLTGSTVTFAWTVGTGVTQYDLHVGTTGAGSSNIFGGAVTGQSKSVTGIPTTGGTLNVRLYSLINGAWQYVDYTFTEESPAAPASMSSPTPSSTLTGSSATFSWTAGSQVKQYDLHVGTTGVGSSNIFAGTVTGQSMSVTGIPTSGGTLYVRLYSLIADTWQYSDYTYTEFNPPAPAAMTSPIPGATLTGSTVTFTWTAGSQVKQYDLHVGTTGAGSSNIFGGVITGQSTTVTGIPTTGGTLNVRLYSLIADTWQYTDYTYTEQ